MNPLDYLPPNVFTHTWGTPTQTVNSLGSYLCVVRPRYERVAASSLGEEDTESKGPPRGVETVCTGQTRTFLPAPHAGSSPLDYTALFVTLHRRQREKVTRLHASRPVPLLAYTLPHAKPLHGYSPSTTAGWMTARTPPSPAAAAVYASQNRELDRLRRRVDRVATSAGQSIAHPAGASGGRLSVVEHPVPESAAAAMAHVGATPRVSAAEPSSPVGTADRHRHERSTRQGPRDMQYRVGRSGSTQLLPFSGQDGETPSNTGSDPPAFPIRSTGETDSQPLTWALSSSSSSSLASVPPSTTTSVPCDNASIGSPPFSPIRASGTGEGPTVTVEVTRLQGNTERTYDLVCDDSPPRSGEGVMADVQPPCRPLSRHLPLHRVDGSGDVRGNDDADDSQGGVYGRPHMREQTAEDVRFSPESRETHRLESGRGAPGGRQPATAAMSYLLSGLREDLVYETRADSVVSTQNSCLASAQTRSRGDISPSPQPHDAPSRWRRDQITQRRRRPPPPPQPNVAQQCPGDQPQLSPSPAAAVEEDAHRLHTTSAWQRTVGASSPTPTFSDTALRSAAPSGTSVSTQTAQTQSSLSMCVDRDVRSASVRPWPSLAATGIVNVKTPMAAESLAGLSSPTPAGVPHPTSLLIEALTDCIPRRVHSEETGGAEGTLCLDNTTQKGTVLVYARSSASCSHSPAVNEKYAEAVTAAAAAGATGHSAWKPASRNSTCLSASATGQTVASGCRTGDNLDCNGNNSQDQQGAVLEEPGEVDEDTPIVRRTSPGISVGTGDTSRSRRHSSSPGVADPQDEMSHRAALVSTRGRSDADCVCGRDSRAPPWPRAASMSSSSPLEPRHARTHTKIGGFDMGTAFENHDDDDDKARGLAETPAPTTTTSPMVYLSEMLCLSSSSSHRGGDGSTVVATDAEAAQKTQCEGRAHISPQGRHTRHLSYPRPDSLSHSGDSGEDNDDDLLLCRGAASVSSSPPSHTRTAMRRVWVLEDEMSFDSNSPAPPLSPLSTRHDPDRPAASVATMELCASTPHRVASRLTLSADERRLHASTAIPLTTTPVKSSTGSSILSIFSTPAQTRLQSLLQASTWSTAVPCSREEEDINPSSRCTGPDRNLHDAPATWTKWRQNLRVTEEGRDDVEYKPVMGATDQSPRNHSPTAGAAASACFGTPCDQHKQKLDSVGFSNSPVRDHEPRHRSNSSSMTPTRLSTAYTFLAVTQASAASIRTPSRTAVADASPVAASPVHPSPLRGSGSFLRVRPDWRRGLSTVRQSGTDGDDAARFSGYSGANRLSCAPEMDVQHLTRMTRLTHKRGCSTAAAGIASDACNQAPSSQQPPQPQPSSLPASPSRHSTGSLEFFLAAAAGSPGSGGGVPDNNDDDEERRVRALGSGVYGYAVARRRSWAPQKRYQGDRQRSHSSMVIHSPSASAHSSGSRLSEVLALAPQRLTFGSAIASVARAHGNRDSAERWPTAYSSPVVVALSHPRQEWQRRTPPPAYAFSPENARRRSGGSREAGWCSRRSVSLPSDPRAVSPQQSWGGLPMSSSPPPSPFAPRTPSGRPSLSSTEFNMAPRRQGRARGDGYNAWSHTTASMENPAEQRPQHVRGTFCRSPSLRSGSAGGGSLGGIGGHRRANRALSFSLLHSPSSSIATPLEGRFGAPSPSPLNSGRQRRANSNRSVARSRESFNSTTTTTTTADGSHASASLMLQPQAAQAWTSPSTLQPTLADELRLFTNPAFPTVLAQPMVSTTTPTSTPTNTTTAVPPPLATFIASPPQRTGPQGSATAHAPSCVTHAPHQRTSLPPELLALMQKRHSTSAAASASVSSTLAQTPGRTTTVPPHTASCFPCKPVQRQGCSERPEVNVENREASPSSPQ